MKTKVIIVFAAIGLIFSSCEKDEVKKDKITFEDFNLDESGVYNGSDLAEEFIIGNAIFPVSYNVEYDFWQSGFAISNHSDTQTEGHANLYSCIAGSGAFGSPNFAIFSTWSSDTLKFIVPEKVTNLSISNSTYAYYSMLNGDEIAKQFGGDRGDDGDIFKLKISCLNVANETWNIEINLANYTYVNNAEDFIIDRWYDIDLSEAGYLQYMAFSFESTDTNDYGILTPAYVCLDNLYGELEE